MSGVTEIVPDWLAAVCCKFKPLHDIKYYETVDQVGQKRYRWVAGQKRFMDQLGILLV